MIPSLNKTDGFTLIEVLIAVVLLAVGLLGLAGLQANSLRNNQNAYFRSIATQYTYNIADRMRANRVEANKGAASKYLISPATARSKSGCNASTGCTPTDMAENDLYVWNAALAGDLPLGTGSINYSAGVFTVSVRWDETKDGVVNEEDPNFQISFI